MRRCRRYKCYPFSSQWQRHNLEVFPIMRRNEESGEGSPQQLGLWIVGLGSQYPQHLFGPEKLDAFVKRLYDVEIPGSDRYFPWLIGN